MKNIALFPGTFDPITYGHVNVIERALNHFDSLIIAVATAANKTPLFTPEERKNLIYDALPQAIRPQVKLVALEGLLVDSARHHDARVIIRGLRHELDFRYEAEMALLNSELNSDIETFFLLTDPRWHAVSASRMREIAQLGGCVRKWVPEHVAQALKQKYFL